MNVYDLGLSRVGPDSAHVVHRGIIPFGSNAEPPSSQPLYNTILIMRVAYLPFPFFVSFLRSQTIR